MAVRGVLAVSCAVAAVFGAAVWPPERGGAASLPLLGQITAYPTGARGPASITAGPDGNMWFVDDNAPQIGRITADGHVTDFSTASGQPGGHSFPDGIAAGPDGNLWFTDDGGLNGGVPSIGRMTPDGQLTEFSAGLQSADGSVPADIAAGPDGNLWFLDLGDPRKRGVAAIGRITTSGSITEFTSGLAPGRGTALEYIAAGPDGNVWFTNAGDGAPAVGRITPGGQITEFTHGLSARNSRPFGIVSGPDGNLWFADNKDGGSAIGRITPAGAITEFSKGLLPGHNSSPTDLSVGPDGNLWFLDSAVLDQAIGRITPSGQIIEFSASLPRRHDNDLAGLAAGPDGSMWFTHNGSPSAVERITATGAVPASARRPPAFLLTCVRRSKFEGRAAWKCQSRLIARPLRSAGALKAVVSSPEDGLDATGTARHSGTKLVITLTTIRARMLNITPGYTVKLTHGHKRQTTTFDLDF